MNEINGLLELTKLGIIPLCIVGLYFLWRRYCSMVDGRIADLKQWALENEEKPKTA